MIKSNTLAISSWRKNIFLNQPVLKDKIKKILPEYNAEEVLEEVLKFLSLIHKSGNTLSPSKNVDLAWHEFILCTKLYIDFCTENFGKYIHHTPGGKTEQNQSNFKKTINLYIKNYGEPKSIFWGDYAKEEWKSSQCGTCRSN